jgi:hypothetical protein
MNSVETLQRYRRILRLQLLLLFMVALLLILVGTYYLLTAKP